MRKLKALIVDDCREGADTMRLLFKSLKHYAEAVYDGRAAVGLAKVMRPDFILLDIGMSDLNGWEVAEILRQDEALKSTKIYALTGYGDPADVQKSFDAGMDWHFVKPLDMDALWEVLRQQGLI